MGNGWVKVFGSVDGCIIIRYARALSNTPGGAGYVVCNICNIL